MNATKRRRLLLIGLGLLIVAGSFWTYQLKTAVSETSFLQPLASPQDTLAVKVSGAVNRPGTYRLAQTGKVLDAVNAAGGLKGEADATNLVLAGQLTDGMEIRVPQRVAAKEAKSNEQKVVAAVAEKVNINIADSSELERLPGVGPVLAKRIVEYREKHGVFRSAVELKNVPGIGEAKFEKLKDKISL